MVNDFNEKGYIGEQILEFKESVVKKYAQLFGLFQDLNSYSQHKKNDLQVDNQNAQLVITACLFAKILNGAQTVYLLCTYGLTHEAKIILRTLLEALFIIRRIFLEPSYVEQYVRQDQINRLNLIRVSRNHPEPLFSSVRDYATDEIVKSLEEEIQREHIRKDRIEVLAEKAQLKTFYDSLYRLFSADVHSGVSSMKQYVSVDKEGELQTFEWGPQDEDIPTNLAMATDILLRTWHVMDNLFKLGIENELKVYMKKLEEIQNE